MASSRPSGGEGSSGEDADALGGAFHQMAQGLLRVQEVLRLQEQKAATALRETVCQMERKLEERNETIRNLLGAFSARMQAVEERVTRIEERMVPSLIREGSEESGGNGNLEQLETRMGKLETGVQRALSAVFPRVDALVTQLEKTSARGSPGVPSFASTATSNSASNTKSNSSAHCTHASTALRLPAASGRGATMVEGAETAVLWEAIAKERARKRMYDRLREAVTRRRRAQAAPSHLGEELCRASCTGKLEEVRRLLESGADVNYVNSHGDLPLVLALVGGDVGDLVSLLLERGADPNSMDMNGWSALHYAAINDRSGRIVALLVGASADVDARNFHGATPLHCAADGNNEAAVRALLAAGAGKSLKGWNSCWTNKMPFDMAKSDDVRQLLR